MRYTGSINKKSRRLGISILENEKEFSKGKKRKYAPGQHGQKKTKTPSEYKLQLTEKQKIAIRYGMNDAQLRRFVLMARKMAGSNSENLMILLESRLDNLVYRLGFAPTRKAARQMVTHGHILVNGKKNDIPSCVVKEGSIITVKEKSTKIHNVVKPEKDFVEVSEKGGVYKRHPKRDELDPEIKENYVIEYYNRLI